MKGPGELPGALHHVREQQHGSRRNLPRHARHAKIDGLCSGTTDPCTAVVAPRTVPDVPTRGICAPAGSCRTAIARVSHFARRARTTRPTSGVGHVKPAQTRVREERVDGRGNLKEETFAMAGQKIRIRLK